MLLKGEDRHKPRIIQDFTVEVDDVPTWAVLYLLELLKDDLDRLDLELTAPKVRVFFEVTTLSVEEGANPQAEALLQHFDKKHLPVVMHERSTRVRSSIADVEAEDAKKH